MDGTKLPLGVAIGSVIPIDEGGVLLPEPHLTPGMEAEGLASYKPDRLTVLM